MGDKKHWKNHSFSAFKSAAVLLMAAMFVFAACSGASAPADKAADYDTGQAIETAVASEAAAQAETGEEQNTAGAAKGPSLTQPQDNRKIILTANLTIETLDFEKTVSSLQKAVAASGGYVAATNMEGGENSSRRTANITFKVPAEKYSGFLESAGQSGNVVNRSETSEDVTSTILDVESRLKSLRTQEERLLKLMEEVGSLKDLLTIQDRLTEVQYEIENYTANKKTLDYLVSYSTVEIYVMEVFKITEIPPVTYGSRAVNAFFDSWSNVWKGVKELSILLIWLMPLILLLLIAGIVVFSIVKIRNKKLYPDGKPPKKKNPYFTDRPNVPPAAPPVFTPLNRNEQMNQNENNGSAKDTQNPKT